MAYANDSLDDEQFSILCDFYESVNPLYPCWNFDPFCLDPFECLYVQQPNRVSKILRVWQLNFFTKFPWKHLSKFLEYQKFAYKFQAISKIILGLVMTHTILWYAQARENLSTKKAS